MVLVVAHIYVVTMYALCITATILIFVLFYKGSDCWMNALFPVLNIVMCLLLSFMSVHPRIQEAHPQGAGLLQSGVVSLYATYLVCSAITSEPSEDGFQCNPFDQVGSSLSTLLLGAAFTIVAVCFTTVRTATQGESLLGDAESSKSEDKLLNPSSAEVGTGDATKVEDDEVEEVSYNYTFFHVTFLAATMFVYMLITDWATISGSSSDFKIDHGFVAVWVKVVSSWLAGLLYGWTLIAPAIFRDRDFS